MPLGGWSAYERAILQARLNNLALTRTQQEDLARVLRGIEEDFARQATRFRSPSIAQRPHLQALAGGLADEIESHSRSHTLLAARETGEIHSDVTRRLLMQNGMGAEDAQALVASTMGGSGVSAAQAVLSRPEWSSTFRTMRNGFEGQVDDILLNSIARSGTADGLEKELRVFMRGAEAIPDPLLKDRRLIGKRTLQEYMGYDDPTAADVRRVRKQAGSVVSKSSLIARHEQVNAHYEASAEAFAQSPVVRALRFNLSSRHPEADGCDVLASRDLYGLGRGVYPKNRAPSLLHPRCLCYVTAVLVKRLGEIPPDPDMKRNLGKLAKDAKLTPSKERELRRSVAVGEARKIKQLAEENAPNLRQHIKQTLEILALESEIGTAAEVVGIVREVAAPTLELATATLRVAAVSEFVVEEILEDALLIAMFIENPAAAVATLAAVGAAVGREVKSIFTGKSGVTIRSGRIQSQAVDIALPASPPPRLKRGGSLEQHLERAIPWLNRQGWEHAFVFDSDTAAPLLFAQGGPRSIRIPQEHTGHLFGNNMIHNHPGEVDWAFSGGDLAFMHLHGQGTEYVVSRDALYVLSPATAPGPHPNLTGQNHFNHASWKTSYDARADAWWPDDLGPGTWRMDLSNISDFATPESRNVLSGQRRMTTIRYFVRQELELHLDQVSIPDAGDRRESALRLLRTRPKEATDFLAAFMARESLDGPIDWPEGVMFDVSSDEFESIMRHRAQSIFSAEVGYGYRRIRLANPRPSPLLEYPMGYPELADWLGTDSAFTTDYTNGSWRVADDWLTIHLGPFVDERQTDLFSRTWQQPEFVWAAALRHGNTGKIYEGVNHADALGNVPDHIPHETLQDGFITSTGRFIDAREAVEVGQGLRQYMSPLYGSFMEGPLAEDFILGISDPAFYEQFRPPSLRRHVAPPKETFAQLAKLQGFPIETTREISAVFADQLRRRFTSDIQPMSPADGWERFVDDGWSWRVNTEMEVANRIFVQNQVAHDVIDRWLDNFPNDIDLVRLGEVMMLYRSQIDAYNSMIHIAAYDQVLERILLGPLGETVRARLGVIGIDPDHLLIELGRESQNAFFRGLVPEESMEAFLFLKAEAAEKGIAFTPFGAQRPTINKLVQHPAELRYMQNLLENASEIEEAFGQIISVVDGSSQGPYLSNLMQGMVESEFTMPGLEDVHIRDAIDIAVMDLEVDLAQRLGVSVETMEEPLRHMVRSIYERTQDALVNLPETLVLFRGWNVDLNNWGDFDFTDPRVFPDEFPVGTYEASVATNQFEFLDYLNDLAGTPGEGLVSSVALQPFSSTSFSPHISRSFGNLQPGESVGGINPGIMSVIVVPKNRIWSMSTTGLGVLREGEIQLLGGDYPSVNFSYVSMENAFREFWPSLSVTAAVNRGPQAFGGNPFHWLVILRKLADAGLVPNNMIADYARQMKMAVTSDDKNMLVGRLLTEAIAEDFDDLAEILAELQGEGIRLSGMGL